MKTWTWLLLALAGCQPRFIPDAGYRALVERDFKERQAMLPGDLFAVFDAPMTTREREAMQFLYAYSPLVDLATLDGTFFLENTRAAFRAREEMPWGKEIPDEIFRHFVLPPRGGKETLDTARLAFYRELKERAGRHATIEEAALEVNHWCHEKVIYRPTNARAMSPLATASVAYGRCGEESIFALAALRAVCIPARQVYTPRWAHCDDNHAWIEVWTGGAWKYLGACEPEPRLDIAWFTLPVQRAVYVEAEVFGRYEGEEIVLADGSGSKVNVTARYTRARPARVRVIDRQGHPVAGARVEYRVFNYGEFYPVVTLRADERGESRLTLGEGDLLVWASHAGRYGFAKLPADAPGALTLTLDKDVAATYAYTYDLVPPAESPVGAL
ncbi:MAG: transglutaminase-like domain-containing protein, partial [Odoribacteraceae bacterium]|nr:transglutaminase-like domain-containing protein [Odoribacteraceae bacterium]